MNLRHNEKEPKEKIEHVLFILDKSGSMENVKTETITGLNEQIQELRKTSDNIKTFVSLVTFDSAVNFLYWDVPLEDFEDISKDMYQPNGMTAMLDAVGQSISRLKNENENNKNDVSFLIIIISDGSENSSKEYSWPTVAEIVNEVKAKKNWTVTYMGANQDLSVISNCLNIDYGNITSWTTSSHGTGLAYTILNNSLHNYRSVRSTSDAVSMDNTGFYQINTNQPTITN